tara:strand:+ start:277 stop:561 length:285 start_codon:yes stop_codon:yes gene_type:complete
MINSILNFFKKEDRIDYLETKIKNIENKNKIIKKRVAELEICFEKQCKIISDIAINQRSMIDFISLISDIETFTNEESNNNIIIYPVEDDKTYH